MDIVIRAAVVFVFVFVLTRALGRRELSSLEPFDLILLVVTGDLIQQGVTQSDYSIAGALLAITTIGLLTLVVSYLSFRFRRLRPMLEGEPIIVLEHGKPIMRNLRRQRIAVEELQAEARLAGIPDLGDVRWAVLETDGKISFIKGQGPGDGGGESGQRLESPAA